MGLEPKSFTSLLHAIPIRTPNRNLMFKTLFFFSLYAAYDAYPYAQDNVGRIVLLMVTSIGRKISHAEFSFSDITFYLSVLNPKD